MVLPEFSSNSASGWLSLRNDSSMLLISPGRDRPPAMKR